MPQMSPLQWEMLFIFVLAMSSFLLTKLFFTWASSDISSQTNYQSAIEDKSFNWLW